MLVPSPNNGEPRASEPDLHSPENGNAFVAQENHRLSEELDSTCSTPYASAPSSPGRGPDGYFFSAPASPMHFVLSTAPSSSSKPAAFLSPESSAGSIEFEFSSTFSPNISVGKGSMSTADELFFNGQIRPMKLSSHLKRPQMLDPLMDLGLEDEDEESEDRKDAECGQREGTVTRGRDLRSRNKSHHRKARSMSPLRIVAQFEWHEKNVVDDDEVPHLILQVGDSENKQADAPSVENTPSCSASSSRSSSSGRNSKKWIFLKDLLQRSKSEGRVNSKEKFWSSMSFSPGKVKKQASPSLTPCSPRDEKDKNLTEPPKQKRKQVRAKQSAAGKPANGVGKRRVPPSAHELHYNANRAQAEEMKKRTFLPYRQGLLGCLGFSSKGYGALNGLARTLNPVSSR